MRFIITSFQHSGARSICRNGLLLTGCRGTEGRVLLLCTDSISIVKNPMGCRKGICIKNSPHGVFWEISQTLRSAHPEKHFIRGWHGFPFDSLPEIGPCRQIRRLLHLQPEMEVAACNF